MSGKAGVLLVCGGVHSKNIQSGKGLKVAELAGGTALVSGAGGVHSKNIHPKYRGRCGVCVLM